MELDPPEGRAHRQALAERVARWLLANRRHPAAAAVPGRRSPGRRPTSPVHARLLLLPQPRGTARPSRAGDLLARRGTRRCRAHGRRRPVPTRTYWRSATGPACSAVAPRARAATPRPSSCPATRPNSPPPCWPPGADRPRTRHRTAVRARHWPGAQRRWSRPFPRRGGRAGDRPGPHRGHGTVRRLPVTIPRHAGGQPGTYLQRQAGRARQWSSVDPAPLFPFGHGLSWTTFTYSELTVVHVAVDRRGRLRFGHRTQRRRGGRDRGRPAVPLGPVASVVRPQRWLAGFGRVELEPGAAARITFSVHADRTSFTGLDLAKSGAGEIGVAVGRSSGDLPLQGSFTLEGPVRHPAPTGCCPCRSRSSRFMTTTFDDPVFGHPCCPGSGPTRPICRVGSGLLPGDFQLRVVPGPARVPQPRPRELATLGHALDRPNSCTWTGTSLTGPVRPDDPAPRRTYYLVCTRRTAPATSS